MPITIRELIASDTISQAADKINFNFDQLLLNGGGPRGPIGPAGPIGPIGGRGIRGSVWYEGLNSPLTTPPTLTPEDEDNYLQANGDVWTYSESGGTWVLTGVNLTGPVGPAGASGKFSEYQISPYNTAGDTTIYPNLMTLPPGGTSGNTSNRFIKAVIIGGLPGNLPGTTNPNPVPGSEVIASSLAQQIVQPAVSLFVHQLTSGSSAIKFHGGDPLGTFSNLITNLSEIRLANDDCMVISAPKEATSYATVGQADGLRVLTQHRNQLFQAGKRIIFQTGNSSQGSGSGDTNDFIVEAQRNGNGSVPTIQLKVLAGDTAELRLGGISSPAGIKTGVFWANAGAITLQGSASITGNAPIITLNGTTSITGNAPIITLNGSASITGNAPIITLNGSAQTNIYAGPVVLPAGATGKVSIGASQAVEILTGPFATGGGISLRTSAGFFPAPIIISTEAGTGRIDVRSRATPDAINIETTANNAGNINVRTAISSPGNIILRTGTSATGSIEILTDGSNGAGANGQIRIISRRQVEIEALQIPSITSGQVRIRGNQNTGAGGSIRLETMATDSQAIVLTTAAGSTTDINLITGNVSTGNVFVSTANGDGEIILQSAKTSASAITIETVGLATGNISIKTADGATSIGSIGISTGTGSSGSIVLSTITGNGNVFLLSAGSVLQTAGTAFTVIANQAVSITSSNQDITLTAGVPITQNGRVNIIAGTNALIAGTDDPRFAVDANNHYGHISPFLVGLNANIFSSGRYTPSVTPFWNAGISGAIITWTRVGRVVTGTGRAVDWNGVSSVLAVPIVGPGGIINVSGTWVCERPGGIGTLTTGHIETNSNDKFNFLPITGVTGDFGLVFTNTIRFSFSYVII